MSESTTHVPPLHTALALDSHRTISQHSATTNQVSLHQLQQSPIGFNLGPTNGLASLQSLQSLNQVGMGVGYAMPMHMTPFRPLYMPSPDIPPTGFDTSFNGTGVSAAKSGKSAPVGKRMKVSRACDECRRKKTRCDVDSENDVCSLCRRANVMCTFARQQLKRGPARKRSSQPLPLTGNISPSTAHRLATRTRSQSTSDSMRHGKESPVLPPIETLLSRQQTFADGPSEKGQTAPIPIPQQNSRSVAYTGHDTIISPPIIDYQQYSQRAPSLQHSPPQQCQFRPEPPPQQTQTQTKTQTQTQVQAQAQTQTQQQQQQQQQEGQLQPEIQPQMTALQTNNNGLSGFPVLVEVACSQSSKESDSPEATISSSAAPPPSTLSMASPNNKALQSSLVLDSSYDMTGKAPTPPSYYDGGLHGVIHQALMEYYTFCHPIFPILPNSIAEFNAVFQDAGPLRQCLVAAINSSHTGHIDISSVPFGLSGSHIGGADREAHLMALLFVYINTLEYTWLGAAVAECAALNSEPLNPRTERLTALVAVLDRLNGIIFGTRSLFPADLHSVAMRYAPIVPTLIALLTPSVPSASTGHFRTAPEIVLATLGQLGSPGSSTQELLMTLETLATQVQRTPLEKFVQAVLARHRSGSEDLSA